MTATASRPSRASWAKVRTGGHPAIGVPVHVLGGGDRAVYARTEEAAQTAAIRASEARHRALFEASPLPMWVYDLETLRFLAVNDAAVEHYGWSRPEFLAMALPDIRPIEDRDALAADIVATPRGLKQASEWRHRTKAGRIVDVVITSHAVEFDGRAARLVLATDVTERRAAEAALRRSEARFRALVQHASDVTFVVGPDVDAETGADILRVRDVSTSVRRQYGYDPDTLVGASLARLLHPDDVRPVLAAVAELRANPDDVATLRHRVCHADGTWRQAETVAVDLAQEPAVGGLVLTTRDVTERAALEAELAHQAYHDALTGLPNRAHFRRETARALDERRTPGAPAARVAVLLLDLDGFKRVNDTVGHATGDALLVQVADRLLNATRGCDLVARLGGDEFAVLLTNARTDADLATVAARVIGALSRPFLVHGTSATIGASVGIGWGESTRLTGMRSEPDDAATRPAVSAVRLVPVDALIRNADLALYEAKARGKGRHAFFQPSMHAAAVERVALEAALRRGIAEREFALVYQPIIDLASGHAVGVEALVRWHDPARGVVPPAAFIPLAEETDLIIPLGRWVLNEACRQGARWSADAPAGAGLYITVNVSGRQLAHVEFVGHVQEALRASGLAAANLILELTESTVIHQPEVALERLTALKALGVRLAIDDFGTGYSALSYLQTFPIDVLKIDKSFVDRVAEGGQAAALAAAIVGLGRALSLRTVAEGVEHVDQQAALTGMGCALGQGYLFARPLTADAVDALLRGSPIPETA